MNDLQQILQYDSLFGNEVFVNRQALLMILSYFITVSQLLCSIVTALDHLAVYLPTSTPKNLFLYPKPIFLSSSIPRLLHFLSLLSICHNINYKQMSAEAEEQTKLEQTLKTALEECVALARRKIRSKRGIADLQNLLVDYHLNSELASIILEVIKLIVSYQNIGKKDENQQQKQSVSIEEYVSLENALQRCQATNRQKISKHQQLQIYCQELEVKNQEFEQNNKELLNSTKQIITNLKREHQKLLNQNMNLQVRIKEVEGRLDSGEVKDNPMLSTLTKARKKIDIGEASGSHRGQGSHMGSRSGRDSSRSLPRNSLSSIKGNR